MTWSEYYADQLTRARNISLYMVKDFDEKDFYTKVDRVNPGIWILGHMANSESSIVFRALGEEPPLPENWGNWFAIGTKILDDLHQYPPLSEIKQVLNDSHQKTIQRIQKLSEDELLAPANPKMQVFDWLKTVRDALGFAIIHECNHGGQLIFLRKLLNKPGLV